MKRLLSVIIILLISAGFINSCGKNETTTTTAYQSEGTMDNPITTIQTNTDVPYSGTVGNKAAGMSYYRVTVSQGTEYTITLFGLSADADLLVYNDRPFDYILGQECISRKGGTNIEFCTVTAKGSTMNIAVDGQYTASGAKFYISVNSAEAAALCSGYGCFDFETGEFPTEFVSSGTATGWDILNSTTDCANGSNCIKSGSISDSETSCFSYTPSVQTSYVSFNLKVSSEEYHDMLLFYIDNVMHQPIWHGEVAWQRVIFNTTLGTHTYKWCYSKNSSNSSGLDAAWIDDIVIK